MPIPLSTTAVDDVDRRTFLHSCSFLVAAALAVGATGASAESLPVRATHALGVRHRQVSYPLPAADGVEVDREHSVLLARFQDQVFAFSMICPHQRAAVKWLPDQHLFQCTKHKSKYAGDGHYLSGRATRSLDRHPLKVVGMEVVVDEALLLKEDENQAAWQAAVARV
jgi:nitrite reductase/ring-hydroxylating ferredoxin subunit